MRFREKDVATTSKSLEKSWLQGGSYTAKYDAPYTKTYRSTRMCDVETPSFHRERNKGGIICSPMFRDEIYYDATPTSFVAVGTMGSTPITYKDWTLKGLDGCPDVGITSTGDYSVMTEQFKLFSRETSLAITRAHADVNLSEINVLASAGELPETIAWIRNCVQRVLAITKVFHAKREVRAVLRKLRYNAAESVDNVFHVRRLERYMKTLEARKARKALTKKGSIDDTVLNLWLEYRYAVRPLIGDIQNAIRAIDALLSDKRLTARGKELVVGETSSYLTVNPNPNSNSVGVVSMIKVQTNVKARAGCLYVVDAELASMLDILGFDQPLEALWELTRFSFMLDWVFSVGDLLESWFKSSGLSILTSWVTLQVESTQTKRIMSAMLYPGNYTMKWPNQQFVLGSTHTVVRRRWRYPNPALPLLPRFDLKVNLAKLIDLGAIARNLIDGQKIPAVVRRS